MTNNPRMRRDWTLEKGRAIPYFPSLRVDVAGPSFMFIEDISLGIVPFNVRGDRSTFRADLSGDKSETDRAYLLLSSLGGRDHYDIPGMLAGSIREVARNLSWFGRASYEVVRAEEDESVVLLRGFTSQRLFNLWWRWLQVVPKRDKASWNKSFNWLPKDEIWVISMPKSLGGFRGYRAILRKLRRFDIYGPSFWRRDLEHGRSSLMQGFDFQLYRRNIELFEARVTRKWGWNRRDFSDRNWTEFMQFYRTLTFRWAQAILREHIISELNSLLARLDIKATISVSGMPLPHEVLYLRSDMVLGNVSFARAYEATSI